MSSEITPSSPALPSFDRTTAALSREDFFRTLADALPQIVWTARPDGTPEYSNRRWYEFSGLTDDDAARDGWLRVIHPDDYERCLGRWRECVVSGEVYEVEARFRRAADGIYRWHLSRSVPVRGEGGEIIKWFGTCTDVHEQKRLQHDYARSEERLSLAMDAAQLGFWDWNITTGVVVWSDHVARLIRDESDVFEGSFEAFLARLYAPDRELVVAELDRAVREKTPCEIDFRVVWADGSIHWMSGRGRVYADSGGRAVRMIGVVREITERKKAEESLRESLNILRAVSQGTSDAIFVKDIDGRYLLVNPTTALIFNQPEAEVIGRNDAEMMAPEDARLIMATDRRIMATRQPELLEEVVSVNGVTRTFLSTKSPYFDERGEVIGLIGIATDITERKKIEEALRTSEALYRNLTEAMPQIVFTCTPAGRIDYVNHPLFEEADGAEAGRSGDGWIEGLHPDDEAAARAKWDDSVGTGAVFETEFRLHHRAAGEYRWHLCRAVPIRDGGGQIFKWIGTITNIDDWKRADEERRELLARERAARAEAEVANRTKDEFLATLSHELRTPLTAMLGWARMLRSGKLDVEGSKRALEIIERNALVQTQLIEDILDVSRIITGKFRLDVQPISLGPVVASALDVVRPAAEAKSIDLQFAEEAGECLIAGDASRLQQVVWNLLSNAVKFTPSGGSVRVDLRRATGGVDLTVSDSGCGIEPGFLPFVFDRFRQADGSTTRVHSGIGLGLAIVRHIVELHGGSVRAASGGENQGSSFTVHLPSATPANEDAVAAGPFAEAD